ncbi:MAG: hypothetical protein ACE5L6_02020 [Candidatus Bathyarchaeia archaeon]
MSYQPFIDGPGRVNDYVKLNGTIYKIIHVEDFFSPRIGFNTTSNEWQITTFNQLAVGGDTGHRNVNITNVTLMRLLQLTGIEIFTSWLDISLRQPSKMTRWGGGDVPEGIITGLRSPVGAPIRLRNLFTVNEKPIQMRAQNVATTIRVRPMVTLRGFLYELEEGPKQVAHYYEPPIGGIE